VMNTPTIPSPGPTSDQPYEFLYVPNPVAKRLITPAQSVAIAEQTLLDHYHGQIGWASTRQMDLPVSGHPTGFKAKGCILYRLGVAGFRVLALNRTDEGYAVAGRRPTKHVLLSDMRTGECFAIVDEHWSHALRTGACAAVAAKYLMRPGSDTCAITGAGYMAYTSLLAIHAVMKLRQVHVWSRSAERREAFARRATEELGLPVVPMPDPESCVRDVPVVITATSAPSPYLKKDCFAPGVFIYALGGYQEVDTATYRGMTFMVDDREQVRICSEIVQLIRDGAYSDDWVAADLGQVVALPDKRRRRDDEQIVVRSQGLVTQDVAQAFWIYQEARRRGAGISLESGLAEQQTSKLY